MVKIKIIKELIRLQNYILPKNIIVLRIFYFLSMILLGFYLGSWGLGVFTLTASLLAFKKGHFPAKDKLEHYYFGVVNFFIFGLPLYNYIVPFIGDIFQWSSWISPNIIIVAIPSILAGASKEIWDLFGNGKPEVNDFIKTIQFSVLYILIN